MATREYRGEGIVVHWDSERCVHSERCTGGLPAVFDRTARPWVDAGAASADAIARVIDTCPSGALSYTRTDGEPNGRRGRALDEDPARSIAVDPEWATTTVSSPTELPATPVTITPLANGPLAVIGTAALARPDGAVEVAQRWTLCRCGQSGTKPLCDGTHSVVGFTAPGADGPLP